MGALSSRQDAGLEDVDSPPGTVYRFPPKSGNYFASHFIMGGETFDSAHPEGYLFGENSDLNFLGARPVTFPYAAPPPQDPVKTLRSLISIRKDTLRLVRSAGEEQDGTGYNVEFTFDADARVAITIYCQATEAMQNGRASYTVRDCSLQSETIHFTRGVCQHFCLPTHTIDPSGWLEDEMSGSEGAVYPMVIHAVVEEGEEHLGHSHVLLTTFDKNLDGNCSVKPLKQKQVVDGVSYLLQEIYGIENKYNSQEWKGGDDELGDNSAECVVCLSDVRDTLILPCRHLCLCNNCADTLRYQASSCPICRLPFRALLQIRAMRKKMDALSPGNYDGVIAPHRPESDDQLHPDRVPHGYEVVSLLEALNGPLTPPSAPPLTPGPLHPLWPQHRDPPVRGPEPLGPGTGANIEQQLKESESRSQSGGSWTTEPEGGCESEAHTPTPPQTPPQTEGAGESPESETVTLSSLRGVEPRSPTVPSGSISSPDDGSSSLAQSAMSMASSQFSMDTMSSLSGSSLPQGPASPEEGLTEASTEEEGNERETPPVQETPAVGTEHRDSEGNAVAEERARVAEHESGDHGWWDRTADSPVSDNNNQLEGLDNDPCTEVIAPGTAGVEDGRGLWTPNPEGTETPEDAPSQYTPLTL